MTMFWRHAVPALLCLITLMWAAENLYFMEHASERAKNLCIMKEARWTTLLDGPNSYYWCLRRVDAGGVP
jgi:hypothetical protein